MSSQTSLYISATSGFISDSVPMARYGDQTIPRIRAHSVAQVVFEWILAFEGAKQSDPCRDKTCGFGAINTMWYSH